MKENKVVFRIQTSCFPGTKQMLWCWL